mgnify:CR=1 FL=1
MRCSISCFQSFDHILETGWRDINTVDGNLHSILGDVCLYLDALTPSNGGYNGAWIWMEENETEIQHNVLYVSYARLVEVLYWTKRSFFIEVCSWSAKEPVRLFSQ